jgi:hypothetical protein
MCKSINACPVVSVNTFRVAFLIFTNHMFYCQLMVLLNLNLKRNLLYFKILLLCFYTRQSNKSQGQRADLENTQSTREDEKKHTYGNITGNNFIVLLQQLDLVFPRRYFMHKYM